MAREADGREHGDRPRLDGRLPGGAGAVPELARRPALRPLRRREPPRLRRDRPGRVLRAAARPRRAADDLAADAAATSSPSTRSSRAYERIFSLHLSAKLSGTFASADARPRRLGGDRVRVIDTGTASAAIAMLALAIQRRLERGTTDEEIDALVERYRREQAGSSSPSTRSSTSQKGGRIGRAQRFAGALLNVKPILSIRDGEVVPVKRVRGNQKAFAEFARVFESTTTDATEPARRDRARRRARAAQALRETGRARTPAGRDRDRDDARRGRRHARRPGHGRLLLVPGRD